ncbi:Alpha-amylase isozyme 3B [Vitis vinifera]|uniref:Alpha-amylase isozyme 3B n=1 Tax=Vitis vinifera TaxID=29760 RepID=A0A438FMB8_VITVI|nr:Alpha-amylase isozyme 3B [Vitis vinifera]
MDNNSFGGNRVWSSVPVNLGVEKTQKNGYYYFPLISVVLQHHPPNLNGFSNIVSGFNWESSKKQGGWYNFLINSIPELSASGITHVWLPPPSQSNASEGKNQYIENLLDSFII